MVGFFLRLPPLGTLTLIFLYSHHFGGYAQYHITMLKNKWLKFLSGPHLEELRQYHIGHILMLV